MSRSRIEVWANWIYDNWIWLLAPPFAGIVLILFIYGYFAADPDLSDRRRRTAIFMQLNSEMDKIELPPSSAINGREGGHKQTSILISTRYRTEASKEMFFEAIDESLSRRGWISYTGIQDRSAVRTFHYCRGKQDATLYLKGKSIFDSEVGDYWELSFSVGLRSKPGVFGIGPMPAGCAD